jgi:hypothetical protein
MEGIGTVAAIGGFLLAAVLLYAVLMQRKRTSRGVARTEQATHDLYKQVDAQDKQSDPDPKNF